MNVPILKQGAYLIATVQAALSDDQLQALQDELSDRVGRHRIRGVVIDVGAMDVLDSYATRSLRTIADVLHLRGAMTVIVGVQPDVAFAMVRMGLNLQGLSTALDLESGLALLSNGRTHR